MSDEKRQQLIIDNMKLVYLVIDNLHLRKNLEEYVDLGMIGLCRGVDTFDPSKGYAISTYLYRCISNEILMYLRKKRPICVSLENEIDEDITGHEVVRDINTNVEEDYLEKEKHEIMYKCIHLLTPKEQFIVNSLFGLNGVKQITQMELGKILNTTQAQISKTKGEIIEKLKELVMRGEY